MQRHTSYSPCVQQDEDKVSMGNFQWVVKSPDFTYIIMINSTFVF